MFETIFFSPLYYIFVFLLGIAIGSFLNVVILRFEKDEHIYGRSYCPYCKKTLRWFELLPLVSYLLQFGRCRNCKHMLSVQYPLVELGTGLLFALIVYKIIGGVGVLFVPSYALGATLILHFFIWSLFAVIAVHDLRTKLIPTICLYMVLIATFGLLFVSGDTFSTPDMWSVLAGPLLFLPFFFLSSMSGEKWMGAGDGKIALAIGWFLGLSLGGTAILFSFWIGAIVSVGILLFQKLYTYSVKVTTGKELTLKSEVPFGPYLVLGTLIVYIFEINLFSNVVYLF